MKWQYKTLLTGIIIVLLIVAIGSIASRRLNFNYAYLAFVSYALYGTIGFIATRRGNLRTGVLLAAGAQLFDSIIGWKLSTLLHANTGQLDNQQPAFWLWLIVVIFTTGLGALAGLIGGAVAIALKKKTKEISH